MAGEAALLGDPYQRQRAALQQAAGAVEAGFKQVLMGGEADAVLELGVEVAGAQAGDVGQFGNTDAPCQVFADISVQALHIDDAGRAAAGAAEQAQVQGA